MNDCPSPTGRPGPAALALGFAGAGALCLLLRDLLLAFCGNEAALCAATSLLPLAMLGGVALCRRFLPGREPADLLAPTLGLLALCLPLALAGVRLVHPLLAPGLDPADGVSVPLTLGCGLAAFALLGLCLGAVAWLTARTAARRQVPGDRRLRAFLAVGACLGGLFVQFVAIPKLTPVNASLDLAIACCVAGVLCASGAPGGRGLETWLSLLAIGFVLLLPLSGLLDARLAAFSWQCPVDAAPAIPAGRGLLPAIGPMLLLRTFGPTFLLALWLVWDGRRRGAETGRTDRGGLGAGMIEAALPFCLLFGFAAVGGDLFARLAALLAAYAGGQALVLFRTASRQGSGLDAVVSPAHLTGAVLGLALPAVLFLV